MLDFNHRLTLPYGIARPVEPAVAALSLAYSLGALGTSAVGLLAIGIGRCETSPFQARALASIRASRLNSAEPRISIECQPRASGISIIAGIVFKSSRSS
nr:hypothetical protein [Sphingobium sp.]